ncbi:hypothetical protein C8R47DRAFT_1220335 [Mycena vitilis]|nr:hypothetical protein C8R47DRAFT_1220335 [Mycena vitilis]
MSLSSISVPYADLTFHGLTIANHEYLNLDSAEDMAQARVWTDLASTYGVTPIKYHSTSGGKCTSDISSPGATRTSVDRSTFTTVFNIREWGRSDGSKGSQREYIDRLDRLIDSI